MTESPNHLSVSATVWPWREKEAAGKTGDPVAARRKRATVEAAVACCVGLLLLFVLKKPHIAAVVFSIAGLVLVGGLFVEPIYRGFKKLG